MPTLTAYGIFAGNRFAWTTNRKDAYELARKHSALLTATTHCSENRVYDAPTLRTLSEPLADYRPVDFEKPSGMNGEFHYRQNERVTYRRQTWRRTWWYGTVTGFRIGACGFPIYEVTLDSGRVIDAHSFELGSPRTPRPNETTADLPGTGRNA